MYTETLHDKTGSFVASVSANISELSEGHQDLVVRIWPNWIDFRMFCFDWIPSMSREDVDHLCFQLYPSFR